MIEVSAQQIKEMVLAELGMPDLGLIVNRVGDGGFSVTVLSPSGSGKESWQNPVETICAHLKLKYRLKP